LQLTSSTSPSLTSSGFTPEIAVPLDWFCNHGGRLLETQIKRIVLQQSSSSSLWLRGGALHADDASAAF